MPAPATSSRHLYTGHHRGHIQPAPRLRAHRGEPLSRDHPQIPVSMPSLFRFDASAVVHTCSSSHRTPAPLTARRQPQRSPPRLLTDAACGGLESRPFARNDRNALAIGLDIVREWILNGLAPQKAEDVGRQAVEMGLVRERLEDSEPSRLQHQERYCLRTGRTGSSSSRRVVLAHLLRDAVLDRTRPH